MRELPLLSFGAITVVSFFVFIFSSASNICSTFRGTREKEQTINDKEL